VDVVLFSTAYPERPENYDSVYLDKEDFNRNYDYESGAYIKNILPLIQTSDDEPKKPCVFFCCNRVGSQTYEGDEKRFDGGSFCARLAPKFEIINRLKMKEEDAHLYTIVIK